MLKLTYSRKQDEFKTVTVLGDPEGIRDLFWQLTRNYLANDGTEIGKIVVTNLDGFAIDLDDFMKNPHRYDSHLSDLKR